MDKNKPTPQVNECIRGACFDVVAIAASAGGLKAVSVVLSGLANDFPAAVLVVQHLDPKHNSIMAEILQKRTPLAVKQVQAGDSIQPGTVFVARPDYHLLAGHDGALLLSQSERVHFLRPSADRLFESVAQVYKHRAIAVVLTGTGVDGSQGIQAVHAASGCVIVQSVDSSEFGGMPGSAIGTGAADHILPVEQIAPALNMLVRTGSLMA